MVRNDLVLSQMAVVQEQQLNSAQAASDPTASLTIKTLERSDVAQLEGLLSQLSTVGHVSMEREDEFFAAVSRSSAHAVYVIADAQGKLYGAATLLVEKKLLHGGASVGHIEDVVVSSALRGKGYGRLLVTALVQAAREQNCYKVILDCSDENIPFYQKCGLSKYGNEMGIYF